MKVYKLIKEKLNKDSIDKIVNDVKILAENALKLAEEAKAEAERQAVKIQARVRGFAVRKKEAAKKEAEEKEKKERL